MSKQQPHIDQLFRRYLIGDIGPQEEAELEAYAQKDEALAAAMQAIRDQPTLDHGAAVERIKKRLPREKRRGSPTLLYRWAAVACILLAVGAASLRWLPEWLNTSQSDIAMRKTESQETANEAKSMAIEETVELDPDTLAVAQKPTASPEPSMPAAAQKTSKKQTKTAAPPDENQEGATSEQAILAEEPSLNAVENDLPVLTQQTEIADKPAQAAAKTKISAPTSPAAPATTMTAQDRLSADFTQAAKLPSIAGYVTNEEGEPIVDVEVLLAGQPMGVRTDSSGFFELKGISGSERISLSHPGYRSFALSFGRDRRELQIALEAVKEESDTDWMLEAARTTIYPNPPRSFAYPQQGMKALKKAIIQQIPPELRQGKIRISFTVDKLGKVSNITADENTPAALLENIGNYLRQNSRWQLLNNGNEPVEVSMILRL